MKKLLMILSIASVATSAFAEKTTALIADDNAFFYYQCTANNFQAEIGGGMHGAVSEMKVLVATGDTLKYELLKNNDLQVSQFDKNDRFKQIGKSVLIPKAHFSKTTQTMLGKIEIECNYSFYTKKDL